MTCDALLSEEAREYLLALDGTSRRIATDALRTLADDPKPRSGSNAGDTERVTVRGEDLYRRPVGTTHAAFYVVGESAEEVRVVEIVAIDEARDRYGV